METSIELINEIKELGKGIYKFTVEYFCNNRNKTVNDRVNLNKVSSGKVALSILQSSLRNSGADIEYIEVKDYFYIETTETKHTIESVTKKVKIEKESKTVLSKEDLQEIETI